jgi:hypothetical protein
VALLTTSCGAPPSLDPSGLIGKTMERVDEEVGERDITQLVQDVSVTVGREPVFTGDDLASDLWTVVAACADAADVYDATVLELAVIPADSFSASIARQVSAGDFDDTVVCDF